MRSVCAAILTVVLANAAAAPARADATAAQTWPQRPVTIVVPFQAGGSADLLARIVQHTLQNDLGAPVVVENRSGAGGSIGAAYVAKAPNDGYTLLLGTFSTNVLNAFMYDKLPYDSERDFQPLALLVRFPNLLVVGPKNPARNVPELIDYIKARDGKLNYGSSGVGTSSHLAVVMFELASGTHMTHVPFRSTAEDLTSMMNGSIDLAIDSMPTLWPQAQAGVIRALAVSTEQRSPIAPDLPTIGETLPGYAVTAWQGLFAPAGTPRSIVEKIATTLQRSFARPDVTDELTKVGGEPTYIGPDAFSAYIRSELPKWRDVVKASGVHLD